MKIKMKTNFKIMILMTKLAQPQAKILKKMKQKNNIKNQKNLELKVYLTRREKRDMVVFIFQERSYNLLNKKKRKKYLLKKKENYLYHQTKIILIVLNIV